MRDRRLWARRPEIGTRKSYQVRSDRVLVGNFFTALHILRSRRRELHFAGFFGGFNSRAILKIVRLFILSMKVITKQTYKIFWRHAMRYKLLIVLMVAAMMGAVGVGITVPLYYKNFFNTAAAAMAGDAGNTVETLTGIIVFILILRSIEWAIWRIARFSNNYFQPRAMADLANTCFEYLHQHSYGFFTNRFVGALVRKVNRLVDAFEGIGDRLYEDLLPTGLRILAVLSVLFYHNTLIGLILVGWTVLYLLINYWFALYKLRYDSERAEIDSQTTAQLADTITNAVNIKVFTGFKDESRGFKRLTEKQRAIRLLSWNLDEAMNAGQVVLGILLEFAVFYFAVRFWHQGILTLGDFVLIQAYLLQIFNQLWGFGRVVRSMYRHLADAEEMVEILNLPHEIQDKPRSKKLVVKEGAIEFKNVSFTYTKTRDVIKNFDLAIAAGERVGLVGPSGAGKSTITALILRFYDVTEGAILIDGQNTADVTQESLRQNIAYVPQDPILFHRTLMENIRYGRRDATDKEVMRAAKLAHCDEFIEKLADGYNTYVGERGIKLSGGERQRVAIARAILKNATILVLDEATSSLDSHVEALIQDALAKLMEGKTTIVIAHRLSTIMKMDRIVVVEEGRIQETGTHQELLENAKGLYKKLWEVQAGGFIAA